MKLIFIYSLISIAGCAILFGCKQEKSADHVLKDANIYTMDDKLPKAEAVAVKGDKIVFVGSNKEAEQWIGKSTNVISLAGKTLTPGFIESHGHFMEVGFNELNLNLQNIRSFEEIVELVKEAASKSEPGQWIIGNGWHQDKWDSLPSEMINGFPVHKALSLISPNNPVMLSHASGHMILVNAKAMEIAGVNVLAKEKSQLNQIEGGEIVRDNIGNPTGMFVENASMLISKFVPQNDDRRNDQAMKLAIQACQRNGITSFDDAGIDRETIERYKKFKKDGKLGVRVYAMITGWDRNLVYEYFKNGPEIDPDHLFTIRSVKLNCDGALGSRGAWLLAPYSDRPDFYGMATLPMDTVLKTSRLALKSGFQVCSHAIGDRANHEILNQYEKAFKENPSKAKDHRFRIEHAQHLHPDDIPRFGKLGVIASMQAIHMSSDRPWAIERLGEKRIKEGAYVWQKLLQSGAKVINGTDAPIEPINPIPCFYASVTRKTLNGTPEGGYEADQKMTRDQALRSYTLDAAFGSFEENIKGSITIGKFADFTVFSQDIMTIQEKEILQTNVVMTILGGKVVYKKQ